MFEFFQVHLLTGILLRIRVVAYVAKLNLLIIYLEVVPLIPILEKCSQLMLIGAIWERVLMISWIPTLKW